MIIFVAGVYGSGKTTICSRLAADLGYLSVSASELIRARRGNATWNSSKETQDIERNQQILVEAVAELKINHRNILLDGHFALLDFETRITVLPHKIFDNLNVDKIILIEASVQDIELRLKARDKKEWDRKLIKELIISERNNALAYHQATGTPLKIVSSNNYRDIIPFLEN